LSSIVLAFSAIVWWLHAEMGLSRVVLALFDEAIKNERAIRRGSSRQPGVCGCS
jgi:hypothetical protein